MNKLPESPKNSFDVEKLKHKNPNRIGIKIERNKRFIDCILTNTINIDEEIKINNEPEASMPSMPSIKLIALENHTRKNHKKNIVTALNIIDSKGITLFKYSLKMNKSQAARIIWTTSFF